MCLCACEAALRLVACGARWALTLVNLILFAVGVTLVWGGLWLLYSFNNVDGHELEFVGQEVSVGLLLIGVMLSSVSLFGCTKERGSGYYTAMILLSVAEIVVGYSLYDAYSRELDDQGKDQPDISGELRKQINCAYDACCRGIQAAEGCGVQSPNTCKDLPLVFSDPDSCSGGRQEYEDAVVEWAQSLIEPVIGVLAVLAILQLSMALIGCIVACCCRSPVVRERYYYIVREQEQQQQDRYNSGYHQLGQDYVPVAPTVSSNGARSSAPVAQLA